jgi:hypothetical protein
MAVNERECDGHLVDRVAQARVGDAEVLGCLGHRLGAVAVLVSLVGRLDGSSSELRRVWAGRTPSRDRVTSSVQVSSQSGDAHVSTRDVHDLHLDLTARPNCR